MADGARQLSRALDKHIGFDLSFGENGDLQCNADSVFTKWWKRPSVEQRTERAVANATVLLRLLERQAPLTPREVDTHKLTQLARDYYKREIRPIKDNDPIFGELLLRLHAITVGVTPESLRAPQNEGFLDFALKNHLHRSLSARDHTLDVAPDNTIHIRVDGRNRRWADVRDEIEEQEGMYLQEGWTALQPTAWETLRPTLIDPENHDYIIEVCTSLSELPRQQGDHSWVRIWVPSEGPNTCNGYAPGFYRPPKPTMRDLTHKMLMIREATLQLEDMSERWRWTEGSEGTKNEELYTIRWKITAQQAQDIIQKVEHDQATGHNLWYSVYRSCVNYTNEAAKLAGADFPHTISVFTVWRIAATESIRIGLYRNLPDTVYFAAMRVFRVIAQTFATLTNLIPERIRWVITEVAVFPIGVALNIIFYFWGGAREIAPGVEDRVPTDLEPIFTSKWQLLDPYHLLIVPHPWVVGQQIRQEIEAWRNEEITRLRQEGGPGLEAQIREIQLSLPPKYKKDEEEAC